MAEEKLVTGTRWLDEPVTLPVGSHCNILQYRLLKRCSDRRNTSLWNWYRERYPEQTIELVGADLGLVHLQRARLWSANLQYAELKNAKLQHAVLQNAKLQHAFLQNAKLQHASLNQTNLQHADLWNADLQHADLTVANLKNAQLWSVNLQHSKMKEADLRETEFCMSDMEGVEIRSCIMRDARFSGNAIDSQTDFTGSNIHEAIMTPQLEAQLQCNMRRINWREETSWKTPMWGEGPEKQPRDWRQRISLHFLWVFAVIGQCIRGVFYCKPTRLFWWASDYGTSSKRLLGVFFFLALGFAGLYWWHPETVMGLSSVEIDGAMETLEGWRLVLRSLYFSVVTMTTLGFGDIHANPRSGCGHVFLMAQVLMGYFLLGALITRFGIMFTTNAPCPKIPRAEVDKWTYPFKQAWGWIRKICRK